MALTPFTILDSDPVPNFLGTVAIVSNTDTQGIQITFAGKPPRWIRITGDNVWYWHQADTKLITAMEKLNSGEREQFQIQGGTFTLYLKSDVGVTATLRVAVIF